MVGPFIDHYRIVDKIGAGGMGEVYRAEDTKLKRDVAIKMVPRDLARDEDLMERFQREARILASLNHPNVASIYGVLEVEGTRALVLELVEGPTLQEHLAAVEASGRRGLPLREALTLALQIVAGLEAAHEKGIVHRDLKPANVKITGDQEIKILDFGLGKPLADMGEDGLSSGSSRLITMKRQTSHGMILGTASYMPPEQARGKSVDRRADIWSFGVVLYEMLTGERMFAGDTVTDVLAAVVTRDPDWGALPRNTPPAIRRLLRRCLERDAKNRLRDIGEARVAIGDVLNDPKKASQDSVRRYHEGSPRRTVLWAGASLLAIGLAFFAGVLSKDEPRARSTVHASVQLPDDVTLFMGMRPSLALSPDGARLVIVTEQEGGSRLYQRSLAEESVVPIPGTEDASGPFFSPDGRFVGFFAEGKLKRVSSEGGAPVVLADAPAGQGASFAPDGSVVFSPVHGEGLSRVRGSGGSAEALTTVDRTAGEAGHHWPHVLPDGKHALITVEVNGKPYSEARIGLVSLDGQRQQPVRVLFEGGADARYVPSGHIVYWSAGDLWAVGFDLEGLELAGAPFPVMRDVMAGEPNGFAQYAFSNDATFVSISGRHPQEERSLVLVDRSGSERILTGERRSFENPRISPDGRRLAVNVTAANDSLWVYDLERRTLTRMTLEDENRRAVWSPAGERLAFFSHPEGSSYTIQIADLNAGGASELLREADRPETPESWSAGDVLAFTRRELETGSDIWVLPLGTDSGARPLLSSRFEEGEARFSHDGRWLAYQSDESGRPEVYVRAFPGPGAKRQISVDGGTEPRWGRDGRELYFRRGQAIMAADITASGETAFEASVPRELFRAPRTDENLEVSSWDALPDGQGFVFIREHAQPRSSVNLVMGWFAEIDALESRTRR